MTVSDSKPVRSRRAGFGPFNRTVLLRAAPILLPILLLFGVCFINAFFERVVVYDDGTKDIEIRLHAKKKICSIAYAPIWDRDHNSEANNYYEILETFGWGRRIADFKDDHFTLTIRTYSRTEEYRIFFRKYRYSHDNYYAIAGIYEDGTRFHLFDNLPDDPLPKEIVVELP